MEMIYYKNLENIICRDLMFRNIPEEICIQYDNNCFIIETSDEEHVFINAFRYIKPFIDQIPTKEDELANISFEKKVLKDPSGQIWFPPTKEAYYYTIIIDIERSKIIEQYRSDFDNATVEGSKSSFVNIEFQRINALASELVIYAQSENLKEKGLSRSNPNHYIIYLLQETLIDLYQRLESRYNVLLGIRAKRRNEIRSALFEGLSAKSIEDRDITRLKVNKLFENRFSEIYEMFKEDIFNPDGRGDQDEAFLKGMSSNVSFNLSKNSTSKFNYLLHVMWGAKGLYIKKNFPGFTKKMYIEPILKNFNCKYGYFKNRQVIADSMTRTNLAFKIKVDDFFK